MAISLRCPACGVTVDAPDDAEGRLGRCPNCGWTFRIEASEWENLRLSQGLEVAPQPRTSRMAVASLVLGIAGGVCAVPGFVSMPASLVFALISLLLGVFALVLGIAALIRIREKATLLTGRKLAIVGTCLGGLSFVLSVLFTLF